MYGGCFTMQLWLWVWTNFLTIQKQYSDCLVDNLLKHWTVGLGSCPTMQQGMSSSSGALTWTPKLRSFDVTEKKFRWSDRQVSQQQPCKCWWYVLTCDVSVQLCQKCFHVSQPAVDNDAKSTHLYAIRTESCSFRIDFANYDSQDKQKTIFWRQFWLS